MMRLARISSSPRDASTWAAIPTLVATIAAREVLQPRFALKRTDSSRQEGYHTRRLPPAMPCRQLHHPQASPSPTRKSRNITPRSESVRQETAGRASLDRGPTRHPREFLRRCPAVRGVQRFPPEVWPTRRPWASRAGSGEPTAESIMNGLLHQPANRRYEQGSGVGWSAPASFSMVTATASVFSAEPRCMCIALPPGSD